MACNSMTIAAPTNNTKEVHKEFNGLRPSKSFNNLRQKAVIRRSQSDNHLCCIRAASMQPELKGSRSFGIFPFEISTSLIPNSIRSLFDTETSKDTDVETVVERDEETKVKRSNWVARLLEIRSQWKNRQQEEETDGDDLCNVEDDSKCNGCDGCVVDDEMEKEGEIKYDRRAFSRFLAYVPWSDVKVFSKLAFLCNMAYVIPEIKAMDLRRHCGLQFVTSSLEKKAEAEAVKAKLDEDSAALLDSSFENHKPKDTTKSGQKRPIRSSVYEIAASAASYVQARAKDYSSCGSSFEERNCTDSHRSGIQEFEDGGSSPRVYKSEVAAVVAASTMTAVVAADEKEKQKAATALQSLHSSPCEWFICDDSSTYTRCFVIQGSDSLASWQANLFFEPAKFEGTEVLVHRGIYEAAKGIYEQFMPEIIEHLNKHGERAKLQFTGHSLGGSLSLLVNLMLLTRKVVKPSALRPVITFGSPFIFCGGQKILDDLGLDDSHVLSVMMHRDIVPRAFSCNYPNHVAQVLKRLNAPFRSHPCLLKNKLLYSPLGKLFILQPDERSSPSHPMLPPGCALYTLDKTRCGYSASALHAFLNCPHPLETLSDPTAYGSEGTILRDHDSSNYLEAVNQVLKHTSKAAVQRVREERNQLWPLFASPSPHSWNHDFNSDNNSLVPKEVVIV